MAIAALIVLPLGISASQAESCATLASQMRSSGGSPSPQYAQLRRQLAAIQGIERQRQCSAKSAKGGFFNACGDLARSRQDVQRRIAALSGGDRASAVLARYSEQGCAAAGRQRPDSAPTTSRATFGAKTMLFCVRLSDGYFFPAPNSQFAEKDDIKTTLDQCRFICDDAGVDLFALNDISNETEEMISVSDRKPYKDLTAAFRYRDNASFRACDLKRYTQRVAELRARTVTPTNMSNAIIPLPTAKPDRAVVAHPSAEAGGPGAAEGLNVLVVDALVKARPVRVVGPAFFPER